MPETPAALTAADVPVTLTSVDLALPGTVLADVRWYPDGRDGRRAHEEGHLPGAVLVDLDADLSGPASAEAGANPLPAPADFARSMGRLGIGDHTPVLAYDDCGGVAAARLVWMLRALDAPAALLDRGLAGAPGSLERGPVPVTPGRFTPRPWPRDRVAGLDAVVEAAGRSAVRLLDARPPERYAGLDAPDDPRAGHVPGAVNAPWGAALDERGALLPLPELRRALGSGPGDDEQPDDEQPVIAYCGNGVGACHLLLALEAAGHRPGRLWAGSFSQYRGTAHPVER